MFFEFQICDGISGKNFETELENECQLQLESQDARIPLKLFAACIELLDECLNLNPFDNESKLSEDQSFSNDCITFNDRFRCEYFAKLFSVLACYLHNVLSAIDIYGEKVTQYFKNERLKDLQTLQGCSWVLVFHKILFWILEYPVTESIEHIPDASDILVGWGKWKTQQCAGGWFKFSLCFFVVLTVIPQNNNK